MKTIKIFIGWACLIALIHFNSCDNYLEMPEQAGMNRDSVFATYRNTEKYLYDLYRDVPRILLDWSTITVNLNGPSRTALTDEAGALALQSAYSPHKVYAGNVTSTWFTKSTGEDWYDLHWGSIRRNWVMLENIDRVPDATQAQKDRIKGECKTLIALEYFEMWKRYGGLPLLKQSLEASEYPVIVRSSVEEVYNYIIQLCDEAIAIPDFPAKVTNPIEFGRATKALAYGLKARTMLYAASPLFNTATPYMDFGENNKLICFGNYDINRWKNARDAAKAAIDFCESNGYAIVNNAGIDKNYVTASCFRPKDGNSEIIFGTCFSVDQSGNLRYWWMFRGRGGGAAANQPTHNAVEFYSNRDGSKVNWDNGIITTPPNEPTFPYKNLDPRFHQTIVYNGCAWYTNPDMIVQFYDAAPGSGISNGQESRTTARTEYYYGFRKYLTNYEKSAAGFYPMHPIMRLGEMYLIYAEASNEYEGPRDQAFNYMDAIRTRSGMPVMDRTIGQDEFQDLIKAERAVELLAEDHRYFDLKRWKEPEKMLKIYNVNILKHANGTYTYEKYLHQTRLWFEWWYLHPFPYEEVNKNYGLIQNPGW